MRYMKKKKVKLLDRAYLTGVHVCLRLGDHVVSGIIRQIEKLGTTELKDKHMHNSDTIAQIIYYVLSCR